MSETRLKVEGNAFYEIDLNCLKRKEQERGQNERVRKANGNRYDERKRTKYMK